MSEKLKDKRGRWRNKTIAFRVTPEEYDKFQAMVEISGLSKQEFIMKRLENSDVVVMGNPRVYKALRDHMDRLTAELKRLSDFSDMEREEKSFVCFLYQVLAGMALTNQDNGALLERNV